MFIYASILKRGFFMKFIVLLFIYLIKLLLVLKAIFTLLVLLFRILTNLLDV
jgi:hypothetical protein